MTPALAVTRGNAVYLLELYQIHHARCPISDTKRCERCEDLLLDALAAERWLRRQQQEQTG